MRKIFILIQPILVLFIAFVFPVNAENIMKTAMIDGMRIELHILPAEPFFTSEAVLDKIVDSGMLIISGAEPVSPEAMPRPNRHLVVHIFDANTGKAITGAKVSMSFQKLDNKGDPIGRAENVPVVNMQVVGKGLESTHYGNNVMMQSGSYSVKVIAEGKNVDFHVTIRNTAAASSDKMHMH